ncbi:non-ribosomal peptide synthetase [Clostridium akagii]|uniref:non-ribosomal peptide synthetase n=1 Tax=Clostridium akagii TaxID=91623 RepID=UPI000B01F8EA|nr:non-ribosomal peptide synthetase [Clostridium akagii]
MLIVAHHLVIDGVSWRILHEDLEEAYRSIENGEEVSFSRKTSSYKKWVEKLKEYANSKKFISEGKYWKAVQAEEVRKLPKDYKNNNGTFGQGEDITAKFTKEETERLLRKTNKAYRTEINDILLCALALAIEKWAEKEKILINLEGHGREAILEDISIERTIGWFTSMYPVIIDVKHSGDIGYSIKYVKETLRHIPNKGVGYGIIKYLTEPQNKDNICFNVKPEIGFNYLGEFTNNPEGKSFKYSDLSGGESISKLNNKIESISINGLIVNGKLELVFNYSTGQYKYESIKKLSQLYIEKLLEIINHCESKKESEKTPSDYGDSELSIEDLEKILLRKKDIEKIHSLTPMQEGMLYNLISDKDSHAYFEQFDFKIEGNLNLYILTEVLNKIIEKHEILRTAFFYEGISKLKQAVLRKREIEIQYEDIRNLDEKNKKDYIEEFKNEDKNRGFDLENDCLIRVSAIRTGENKCRLVGSFHHIIMDGWSVGIVMKEIVEMYKALAEGKKIVIEETQAYNDYLLWLDKCNKSEALEYWKSYLNGYEKKVEFPKLNTNKKKFKYKKTIKKTDKKLTAKLKNIAEKNNLTLNAIIQAAWGVLLQKYNNADDVVFGTVISGRQVKVQNIENMVGLFINTVPLRVKSEVDTKFIELAKKVNTDFIQSNASYAYASLAEVQAFTNMRNKLINHTVIYENYPIDEKLLSLDKEGDSDLRIKEEDVFEQTDYNLEVLIVPGEEITVKIIYNNSIFLENTINEIFESLFTIIKHVSNNPNIELSKIDMISGEEREMLLYTFNNTDKDYMKAKTIQELFEEQVERTPNAIALEFNGSKLTYFELEKRSNKVARYLINKGIKNNNIIPIIVKKSFELISGIIGILKSGGCYLPIDSDYPMDRINYMLDDSKAKIVLTESDLKSKIDFSGNIVDIRSEDIAGQSDSRLNNINISSDLAYVIYTSGSTGKSKGVAIEHRSVNNFIDGINSKIKIQDDDVIVSVTTCSFDIFGLESIFSLSKGLKVVIAGLKEQMDPKLLNELIIKTDVNVIQTTPSRIKLMLSADNAKNSFKKLKVMMIGGEVFPKDLLFEIRKLTKARIYNMYGPTETTIWSSIKDLTEENDVNVGKPISNTQMYILDKNDNLIPNGNAGELCIAGDGLSRGYLNMEELTKSKFVDNPFSKGKRMYKTGDLARWLPNGDIELIGRLDNQVKINGYRIELGEVQSVANKHEKIKECIAVGIKNGIGSQDLALYYVANGNITITEVVRYLSNKLPYYMVPKRFVEIEKIPLTNNGKVNLKDLPEPINNRKDVGNYYQDADTDTQKNISSIWCKLLEMNNVGIYDNFFEVGGNSIKIVAMYNEIKKIYPNKIEITDIFSHPTIYSLAKRIDNKEKTKKKLDKHVKSIQFPADYIVKGNEHNADSTFRFKFKDKMFEKIVQMKQGGNYEITHILMASYVFLISEICKESVFSIQASISEDDIVSELKFNLLGMKNFYDIAKNVKDNLNNFNNEIMYDTYKSNIIVDRTNENSIVAMFTEVTQSKFNYLTLYDLIFEVHKGNSEIDIVCKYNSKKLKQSKIQQLFYNYIKLIKSIIGNDSV